MNPDNNITVNSETGVLTGNFTNLKPEVRFEVKAFDFKSREPAAVIVTVKAVEKQNIEFKLKK